MIEIDVKAAMLAWARLNLEEEEREFLRELLDDELCIFLSRCGMEAGMKYAIENHEILAGFVEEV